MDLNNHFQSPVKASQERLKDGIFSQNNMIAVYTVLRILVEMEKRLGLEAMLEYIARYLAAIEKDNPPIQNAVSRALQLINVEKIYKETADVPKK